MTLNTLAGTTMKGLAETRPMGCEVLGNMAKRNLGHSLLPHPGVLVSLGLLPSAC